MAKGSRRASAFFAGTGEMPEPPSLGPGKERERERVSRGARGEGLGAEGATLERGSHAAFLARGVAPPPRSSDSRFIKGGCGGNRV